MPLTIEEEKQKQDHQANHELFKQTNQSAIDFSLKSLWALFLLNGAAATALLAQPTVVLKWPALIFAFGALWTVAAMFISYVFILFLCETFRTTYSGDPNAPWIGLPLEKFHKTLLLLGKAGQTLSQNDIHAWRIRLILFSSVPAVLFLLGLIATALTLAFSCSASGNT